MSKNSKKRNQRKDRRVKFFAGLMVVIFLASTFFGLIYSLVYYF